MRKTVKVANIDCAQCAVTIENHFSNLNDITAKVHVPNRSVIFEYDNQQYNDESLFEQLKSIGYLPITSSKEQEEAIKKDKMDLLISTLFSLPLLWTMFAHLGISFIPVPDLFMYGFWQWILSSIVLFIPGRRFFKNAYHQLKAKNLGMDSLVVIGTTTAYIYSIFETLTNPILHVHHFLYFETTAVIIWMVLIGNYFENRVKDKTSNELEALIMLGAKHVNVLRDDLILSVPIEEVDTGETMVVLANDKIPLDGIILSGMSYVDDSMLTGESVPKLRVSGDKVIGSSINLSETIRVKVTATGSKTVLAQIIKTVEDTALIKPKAQRVADKIAAWFVPIVVLISIITFIVWAFFIKTDMTVAFKNAISVLIISCPCALGLATPTSIAVASGIAFKEGILYRGGEFFEVANKISAIAFDKTGTLTQGTPEVIKYSGDNKYLKYTASLEVHSNHPLALSITNYFDNNDYYDVNNFEVLMGLGIKGVINDKLVYVGSGKLLESLNIKDELFKDESVLESTIFYTVVDDEVVNKIYVADQIKDTSYQLIKDLKKRNITPYMITGDNENVANSIASKLDIKHVYANVLPHEKASIISEIQQKHDIVAFVGDGINDAPALKMANVGFAVSNGSDIAIESADVMLNKADMNLVLDAIDLSKATLKNIYINFLWAFAYNIIMIPFAALGYLNPSLAGIGMGLSSILVVLNALSLKLFKFRKEGK